MILVGCLESDVQAQAQEIRSIRTRGTDALADGVASCLSSIGALRSNTSQTVLCLGLA